MINIIDTNNTMPPANPLYDCARELFNIVVDFADDTQLGGATDFFEHVFDAFQRFESQARTYNIDNLSIDHACYALAALIDETVMTSSWSGRDAWMANPLQLTLFGEHLAGEGFFERLQNLQEQGESALVPLEIYFLCLQLGFQGQYRDGDEAVLRRIVLSVKNQLCEVNHEHSLAIDIAGDCHEIQAHWYKYLWFAPAILLTLIYFGYMLVSHHHAVRMVSELNKLLIK